jgi:hypothetical protein
MLGGLDDSAQALANARELLGRAAEWTRSLDSVRPTRANRS